MPQKELRYGAYLGAVRRRQRMVGYNDLVHIERDLPKQRARLRPIDLHRLLTPYVSVRFFEQLRAVLPLAFMLIGFQALALRATPQEAQLIAAGILAVLIGLMFFMEGVKQGLMPFAENIGFLMPGRSPLPVMLTVGLLLGAAATLAEPAIGALQAAGASVSGESAPRLKALLGPQVHWLIFAVALGVGVAVVLGFMRTVLGWQLKRMVLVIVPPCLLLTLYAGSRPDLQPLLGLAWDCGAITTGPVTVPLVLAVGIGVAASAGRGSTPLAGFGIVTLASLLPVLTVLLTAMLIGVPSAPPVQPSAPAWYELSPATEIFAALRAIIPLVALLFVVQRILLRQRIKGAPVLIYGIVLALLGMAIFNLGLTAGLVELGNQAGANVPWAFAPHRQTGAPPLYPQLIGLGLVLLFAFIVGYGATVAEPALNAMGMTVENLTDGAFKKRLLIHAVALGVGFGAALGVARLLFGWSLGGLLVAFYLLALVLTVVAREDFVNLAWDSAGVTTGPVTVPLLLSLGVGLGEAVGASEGFGILALCSVGPIITVLAFGLWVDRQTRRRKAAA
mgnify:CR=1 FL=1